MCTNMGNLEAMCKKTCLTKKPMASIRLAFLCHLSNKRAKYRILTKTELLVVPNFVFITYMENM